MSEKSHWWSGKRGEWYVATQALLFALLIFGPRAIAGLPSLSPHHNWPARIAGGALMLAGAALCLSGFVSLGRNLTPLPHPKEDARLVETGAYRLARHPIYGGFVILAYGWALALPSLLTLAYATLLFVFFDLKSRREERWLNLKFPEYRAYSRKVRKLIPFIY